ncbi:phosphate ABC transporter substrate-binding protein [Sandaracinus amylolyticus]|uniref:Phosphate-binding protein n=1 Tax=Sandaracinus amylolyticus TaxID=927083 RepID=A0A0F6WA21_9BACT|nr:phosphate ABC transporter substrate-binding protein [Sandaracinus amylolyticus]AKF11183.1 Phosphate ABC transporter, periplasmic phosphate-binding protein PstS [Sandaracinus amylolyticus]
MRALNVSLASACALALALAACSGGHRDRGRGQEEGAATTEGAGARLSLKGSDTMVVLAQRWAEGYSRSHPGNTVEVSGGGSGTGIAALLNGTTDIANASRPLRESERTQLTQNGVAPTETRVALDALAVYVHQDNPVQSLTMDQLAQIYRGQITSWSAVGGPDRPIVLYSRENNSGTYAYFKEHVLDDADFAVTAQTLPGTAAVINAVSRDAGGIGYGGIGYASGVRTVAIAGEDRQPVTPTMENATSGRYPLARFLLMITRGEPSGTSREFLDWVRSPDGQALVEQAGFYPLPSS